MANLILLGGGGHCKSVIDVIQRIPEWNLRGIIDDDYSKNSVFEYGVLGDTRDFEEHFDGETRFLVTIGQIKSAEIRKKLFKRIPEDYTATVIATTATKGMYSEVGKGTIIMEHAHVGNGSKIGENCIINTGAIIEHDCTIGNNCHIAVGAVVIGNITICDDVFIGSNSTVIDHIREAGCYVGTPVRRI